MFLLFKANGVDMVREETKDLLKSLETGGYTFQRFSTEAQAKLAAAAQSAAAKITALSVSKRQKLLGGDVTKIGEYNVKDRIAGMQNRDTAKLMASAEAAARGVSPDELLDTWAEKSAQLGMAVTQLSAATVAVLKKIEAAETVEEINALVEEFRNV